MLFFTQTCLRRKWVKIYPKLPAPLNLSFVFNWGYDRKWVKSEWKNSCLFAAGLPFAPEADPE